MINVLMIEDDPEFSLFLGEYLEQYNIKITNYEDPFLGLSAGIGKYDLVILDLTLPGIDGTEVCKKIAQDYNIPIIISSARSDITDKVVTLQIGADYYLPKPYDPKEMYAVIQSLLRRSNRIKEEHKTVIEEPKSDFKFDDSSYSIRFKEKYLDLTQAESEVIICLLKYNSSIVTREMIVDNCDSLSDSYSKSLDVIISRLRNKLGDNPRKPQYIHSVRGMGYKLIQ